jgi:uncharacterized membrane protein
MVTQGSVPEIGLNPDVISAYGYGWKRMWTPFWMLLLIGVIYFVITGVIGVPQWIVAGLSGFKDSPMSPFLLMFSSVYSLFTLAFSFLVAGPIQYGVSYAFLKAARRETVNVEDMFSSFKRNYWNTVFAYFLNTLIVGVGFIFLIIPGIYLACKLAFIPYLVVDRKLDAIEALRQSWKMTNGYGWQVFLIGLLGIFVFIAGFICLGIGVIISVMWISITMASLYYAVSLKNPPELPPPPAPQG